MNCPHCNTHIDEHPASRCLDAWVVETVWGLTNTGGNVWENDEIVLVLSEYSPSTDIAAAWQVLEKLSADGYSYQVLEHSDPKRGDCLCELWKDFFRWTVSHQATIPLAICRAAIKATA